MLIAKKIHDVFHDVQQFLHFLQIIFKDCLRLFLTFAENKMFLFLEEYQAGHSPEYGSFKKSVTLP